MSPMMKNEIRLSRRRGIETHGLSQRPILANREYAGVVPDINPEGDHPAPRLTYEFPVELVRGGM